MRTPDEEREYQELLTEFPDFLSGNTNPSTAVTNNSLTATSPDLYKEQARASQNLIGAEDTLKSITGLQDLSEENLEKYRESIDGLTPGQQAGITAGLTGTAALLGVPFKNTEQTTNRIIDNQIRFGNKTQTQPEAMQSVGERPNAPTESQSALQAELNDRIPKQKAALDNAKKKFNEYNKSIQAIEKNGQKLTFENSGLENKIKAERTKLENKRPSYKGLNAQQAAKFKQLEKAAEVKIRDMESKLVANKTKLKEMSEESIRRDKIRNTIADRIGAYKTALAGRNTLGPTKFNYQGDVDKSISEQKTLNDALTNENALKSNALVKVKSDKGLMELSDKQADLRRIAKDFNLLEPGSDQPLKDMLSEDGLIDQDKLKGKLEKGSYSLFKRYKHYFGSMTLNKFKKILSSKTAIVGGLGSLAGAVQYSMAPSSEERAEFESALRALEEAQRTLQVLK